MFLLQTKMRREEACYPLINEYQYISPTIPEFVIEEIKSEDGCNGDYLGWKCDPRALMHRIRLEAAAEQGECAINAREVASVPGADRVVEKYYIPEAMMNRIRIEATQHAQAILSRRRNPADAESHVNTSSVKVSITNEQVLTFVH